MPGAVQRGTRRARSAARDAAVRAATSESGTFTTLARRALKLESGVPTRAAYWSAAQNLGDTLSPVVMRQSLGFQPVRVPIGHRGKLLGIGSIVDRAAAGDIVWGSGSIDGAPIDLRGVTVRLVRGPRTRACIRNADVPEAYGDPALLLPTFYRPRKLSNTARVGLIPHLTDQEILTSHDPSVAVIDVREPDWQRSVDALASCEFVVTSSLHGIILAEAYGVPAVWVQPSDRITGGEFKFHDFYESTGRERKPQPWSHGLAYLEKQAVAPPAFDLSAIHASATEIARALDIE